MMMQGGNGSTPEQAAALQRELSLITRVIVELTGFREQTMNCLVKLMAANMNPAFRHFVNMFHHPETRIKQANIQILWEVIKEGGHLLPDLVKPVRASGLDKIVDVCISLFFLVLYIFRQRASILTYPIPASRLRTDDLSPRPHPRSRHVQDLRVGGFRGNDRSHSEHL
jgi:hypothetical protein